MAFYLQVQTLVRWSLEPWSVVGASGSFLAVPTFVFNDGHVVRAVLRQAKLSFLLPQGFQDC